MLELESRYLVHANIYDVEVKPCRLCGKPIVWSNSDVTMNKKGDLVFKGITQATKRKINGNEYHLCVCEDCYNKEWKPTKLPKFYATDEKVKWAFNVPDEDYYEDRKKYAMTREKMISKYGPEEGQKRWDKYCARQAETNTFEYKQKTYGWTQEKFDEFNASRAVTKENLIRRHGEEKGLAKWDAYCARQSETKSWPYMVKKYGIEKARAINRSKAITLENMVRLYGETEGRKAYQKWSDTTKFGVSNVSQECFDRMRPIITKSGYTCKYNDHLGEQAIQAGNKTYFLDFYIPELKACVEFNGSVFHGDPRIFEDNEKCNPWAPELTAKDMQDADAERYDLLLKEHGIKTYIIWELDYNDGLDVESLARRIINERTSNRPQ